MQVDSEGLEPSFSGRGPDILPLDDEPVVFSGPGRIRTRTDPVLSRMPLPLGYWTASPSLHCIAITVDTVTSCTGKGSNVYASASQGDAGPIELPMRQSAHPARTVHLELGEFTKRAGYLRQRTPCCKKDRNHRSFFASRASKNRFEFAGKNSRPKRRGVNRVRAYRKCPRLP